MIDTLRLNPYTINYNYTPVKIFKNLLLHLTKCISFYYTLFEHERTKMWDLGDGVGNMYSKRYQTKNGTIKHVLQ